MNIRRQVYINATIIGIIIMTFFTGGKVSARQNYMLERPKIGLDFSYEFSRDERRGPNAERKDTTMTYTEILNFRTKGWVYHPALLIYNLELSPEWQQTFESSSGAEKQMSRTFLSGFLGDVTIFQYKPYTLKLSADRQSERIFNNFAGITKTDTDTLSASLLLKYNVLPTTFNYIHSDSTTTGFYSAERERDNMFLTMRHSRSKLKTSLMTSYSDTKQRSVATLTDNLDRTVELRNSYEPTADRTLKTALRYHDTQGTVADIKRKDISENIKWAHRENLVTNYRLNFNKIEFNESSTETKSVGFNLNHLLYENLRTRFNVYGSDSQSKGLEEVGYGTGLNFNYQRTIPWGMIGLSMGQEYSITESDGSASFANIIEEPVTLTTGGITLLDRTSVDTASIVVTYDPSNPPDPTSGPLEYVEVVDYTIIVINDAVEIRCVLGGRIDIDYGCSDSDGAPVLVSYRYFTYPGSDVSLYGQSYGISLDLWSVLNLFYRFSHREERLIGGFRPGNLIDERSYTTGAELNLKWSRTRVELRDRQSVSVPMKILLLKEVITLKPSDRLFFSATGDYSRTMFKDTGDIETMIGVSSKVEKLISRWGKLSMGVFWKDLSGRAQDITNTGLSALFQWNYRVWRGNISGRFSNEEDSIVGQTFKKYELTFKIKRLMF